MFGEWWSHASGKADKQGAATVQAFFGTNRVRVAGRETTMTLSPREGARILDPE